MALDFAKKPRDRVLRELRSVRDEYPNADISVVAHSFGSYLITRIIGEETDVRLNRVLLCGSVVEQTFRWDMVKSRIGKRDSEARQHIVNDCGTRDVWPVLGRTFGWGYGDAGTNGFGSTLVSDRCHTGGHSLFSSDADFVREYWKPFFHDGEIIPGKGTFREDVPWWLPCIPVLYWLLLLTIVFSAGILALKTSPKSWISGLSRTQLPLVFRLTNKTSDGVTLHPWCEIEIFEGNHSSGIVSYPGYSCELESIPESTGKRLAIPAGESVLFRVTVPIEGLVAELYDRNDGTIQVTFRDADQKFLTSSAWKLSSHLKGISEFPVELTTDEKTEK